MTAVSANPPASAQSSSDAQAVAEAERSGQPFLVFRDQDGRQQLFFFDPGAPSATVGRRSTSDLALHWDDQVSRLHATFERAEDGWALVDDGQSSNGSYVNQERVSGRRRLKDGDVLRFGGTTVRYLAPGERHAPGGRIESAPPRHPPPRPNNAPAGAPRSPDAVSLSTTQRRVLLALCRPYKDRPTFATPATDDQIAEELVLSVNEVRRHVAVLFAKFGVEGPSTVETRVRLAERAFSTGTITEQDL
jgi:pSer/pThr/pTyr-binding forkhead associated (FHA) protein